ncbi:lipopolysaccharide biosynthesis protein [Lapidilactobacillus bayanensis]|uniref:lipopolysaccharide biosynthesis protein n=1 Tax=Lapidilactobacillus bayanensis TaxID=2485998 RepID=UPI000F771197|nr:oligosaccharide flippase family protein [Lapidilactobacillus bayanensis]
MVNKKDNKYNKLLKNSAVFAIGNLGSKLIQVLLVPLYTYVLSTKDYGTVDLLTTTVNLLLPIICLSISDGILRFVMDPNEDNKTIYSNALLITCVGALIVLLIVPFFTIFNIKNVFLTALLLVFQSFQSLNQQFARAINKVKIFAFNGILTTLITAVCNILLLVIFRFGINGYLWSMIIASVVSNVFLFVKLRLNRYIVFQTIKLEKIKVLLIFCIPLIPNSLAWWISNASSRYFILLFVGVSANGLFAVANKIPSLLSTLNTIFFQSWQMSSIEEYNSSSKSIFYSTVFRFYSDFLFLGSSIILLFLRPFMRLFVSTSYYNSWKYVPFLLVAIIYSSFATFLGTNYVAAKQTAGAFTTTIVGAILNVVLNFILVKPFGLYGAGLSSAISYLVMWLVRVKDTQRFVVVTTPKQRIIVNQIIIISQILVLFYVENIILSYIYLTALVCLAVYYNRSVFVTAVQNIAHRFK